MEASVKVCIMAGGAGTRFWPLSTEQKPKQFIDPFRSGTTMIQEAYEKALGLTSIDNIYVLTHEKYRDLIQEQLPDLTPDRVLLEPVRKNTAAAVAFAANWIARDTRNFVMVLLSADQIIRDDEAFSNTVKQVIEQAKENKEHLFTLGIEPDRPHTGYGYLELDSSENGFYKVRRFVEKPDLEKAKSYLESGNYLWNAGIFAWHFKAIESAFTKYASDIWNNFSNAPLDQADQLHQIFEQVRSESIDYAVMEHSEHIYTVRCRFGWNDLGTYSSLYELSTPSDIEKNVCIAKSIQLEKSRENLILLDNDTEAIIRGLDGYIVCLSGNKLLIYPIDEEQALKDSLKQLQDRSL